MAAGTLRTAGAVASTSSTRNSDLRIAVSFCYMRDEQPIVHNDLGNAACDKRPANMGPRSLISHADQIKRAFTEDAGALGITRDNAIDRVLRGEPDARHKLRIIRSPRRSLGLLVNGAVPASLSSGCVPPPFYATSGFQWQTVIEKTSIGAR